MPLSDSGPLFTTRTDVLLPNLVKSRSRKIGCYDDRIVLKFDRHLYCPAADVPVKYQIYWKSLNPKLAPTSLRRPRSAGMEALDISVAGLLQPGARWNTQTVFLGIEIHIAKISRPWDRLIFMIGIPTLVGWHNFIAVPTNDKLHKQRVHIYIWNYL